MVFCVSMNSAVELFRDLLSSLCCIYEKCVQFCAFEHWRLEVEVLMRNIWNGIFADTKSCTEVLFKGSEEWNK